MFCSYCGQAVAANASSCANCGKPLRSAPAQSSALVAFAVIFAITTIGAGWAAIYYAHEAARAREAFGMVSLSRELPPPPPAKEQPCDLGVVGGVPGGVPGGQVGGVVGGIISEAPPSTVVPKRVRVSSGIAQAQLISQTPPAYPPSARQARVQGTVVLQAVVGKEGKVNDLRVLSGHPLLVQSAMDAVKTWRYKPYLLNGEPVEVETMVTVSFKLAP